MPRNRKKKTKTPTIKKVDKLKRAYLLTLRDASGKVLETISHTDYSTLMLEGMERAHDVNGFWEIFNTLGKRLDGNYERKN